MKYDIWKLAGTQEQAAAELRQAGVSPLVAQVLASRGFTGPEEARAFLQSAQAPLPDPDTLPDIAAATDRILRAVEKREKIAVYGDYDVDGITATCLLTEFLRGLGAECTFYIPGRIEEGYGLNAPAITALRDEGVRLIVTVDCGITAVEEARLCRDLGVDLIITDHHACREDLPEAVAVVNPQRPDSAYPFPQLAGVGVAFKLAASLAGDQAAVFEEYCDLVCLGTVADVMPLLGENRAFVMQGIRKLQASRRPGLRQLISDCNITNVSATSIGYVLSPRINAAGRLGKVEWATELLLTRDRNRAAQLSGQLCALNRERQAIESEIYADAKAMLAREPQKDVIVLAGEDWHQGVVGIVASRLAEEYGCPTFLICLDGDRGKASSRSYGGFNLFAALQASADLLESFGGHELAAGFTILRSRIESFREKLAALARAYYADAPAGSVLNVDCAVGDPKLLTMENVEALDELEPCGAAFPKPVFCMDGVLVEQLTEVGGGKHLRLRLGRDGSQFYGIFFSMSELRSGVAEGDRVEVAFYPQINEYRGFKSVQLNLVDIRPQAEDRQAEKTEAALYRQYQAGSLTPDQAANLLPPRSEFVAVWRYLTARSQGGSLQANLSSLPRCIARYAGQPCSYMRTRICLDVFAECGLIAADYQQKSIRITLTSDGRKVDLTKSQIITALRRYQGG